jgi:uncharacterized protein (DUF58 family)
VDGGWIVGGAPKNKWYSRLRLSKPGDRSPAQTVLCREGWYYLGALVFVFSAAMLRQVNLLLILAGMLIGPVVFSRRLVAATLDGLRVRRKLPRGLCAGDLLAVNLEVENPRKRLGSWAVVVEDQIQRDGNGQAPLRPAAYFGYVPAGQGQSRVYRGRLAERGRYRLGPVKVSTRFPFGLFRRTITLDLPDTLLVYPRLGHLTRAWSTRHHESFEGANRRQQRETHISGDFFGVREWRLGDNRRAIHWRSSARRGSLVVRQFEQHRTRDVALLVDLWQPAEATADDLDNVELAVSFAATVITDLCRKGGNDLLLGITAAEPVQLVGPASLVLLEDAMESLALAEASAEDRLPELLDQAAGQLEAGSDVILVSPRRVDLSDARFAALRRDANRRRLARRIRVIHTASDQLSEFFVIRPPESGERMGEADDSRR